jgi:hypothetical protein
MKFAAKSLLSLITEAATFASAQTLPHFQHIIIVVQENRTPTTCLAPPTTHAVARSRLRPASTSRTAATATSHKATTPWCMSPSATPRCP